MLDNLPHRPPLQARRSKYSPEVAKEVLRLFPHDRYTHIIENTTDEAQLRDIVNFLGLLIKASHPKWAEGEQSG